MGDVQLSRNMARILRHGGSDDIQSDGYMFVEDLLRRCGGKYTAADVQQVVKNCPKKRFEMVTDRSTGRLKVRVTQGHTVQLDDEAAGLVPISIRDVPSTVVHGTTAAAWQDIQRMGLSRLRRNHIHFAIGEIGDASVISGMPARSDICIFINTAQAIRDGIKFYRSSNSVILSPGNEQGVLPPKYFLRVTNRRTGAILLA